MLRIAGYTGLTAAGVTVLARQFTCAGYPVTGIMVALGGGYIIGALVCYRLMGKGTWDAHHRV